MTKERKKVISMKWCLNVSFFLVCLWFPWSGSLKVESSSLMKKLTSILNFSSIFLINSKWSPCLLPYTSSCSVSSGNFLPNPFYYHYETRIFSEAFDHHFLLELILNHENNNNKQLEGSNTLIVANVTHKSPALRHWNTLAWEEEEVGVTALNFDIPFCTRQPSKSNTS